MEKKRYKHLSAEQRKNLFVLKEQGLSNIKIAQALGIHQATVGRELKRNGTRCLGYDAELADYKARRRRHCPGSKIARSRGLAELIANQLVMEWSPEVIAGRLKHAPFHHRISHESIYKWIYGEGRHLKLYAHLKCHKRKRGFRPSRKAKRSLIPNRISIHERPPIKEPGHWEGDTLVFAKHQGALVTLYEKQFKLILAKPITHKTKKETAMTIKTLLMPFNKTYRQSLTLDNGTEFCDHETVHSLLKHKTFFCDPYSPWQKGGVENANGLIRRYLPKGTAFADITESQVKSIIEHINHIPRKSLHFKSPMEAYLTHKHKKDIVFDYFKPNRCTSS